MNFIRLNSNFQKPKNIYVRSRTYYVFQQPLTFSNADASTSSASDSDISIHSIFRGIRFNRFGRHAAARLRERSSGSGKTLASTPDGRIGIQFEYRSDRRTNLIAQLSHGSAATHPTTHPLGGFPRDSFDRGREGLGVEGVGGKGDRPLRTFPGKVFRSLPLTYDQRVACGKNRVIGN